MSKRLLEETRIVFRDHDINQSDTLTNVGCSTAWLDMSGYHRCTALLFRTAGTSKVQNAGMYVSAAATGSSASLVGSLTGSTNATGLLVGATMSMSGNAVGIVALDITHDDIAVALPGGRYVCARMALADGTDEFAVIYIFSEPRFAKTTNVTTGNALDAYA